MVDNSANELVSDRVGALAIGSEVDDLLLDFSYATAQASRLARLNSWVRNATAMSAPPIA